MCENMAANNNNKGLFNNVDCMTKVRSGKLFLVQFLLYSDDLGNLFCLRSATSTSSTLFIKAMCNVAYTATF